MYCVHGAASVAGTWRSPRSTVGTNLLPAVDILRAVMSRNKMARRKTGPVPAPFLSTSIHPFLLDFVPSFVVGDEEGKKRPKRDVERRWRKRYLVYITLSTRLPTPVLFISDQSFIFDDEIAVFFSSHPDHFADTSRSSLSDRNERLAAISFLFKFGRKVK